MMQERSPTVHWTETQQRAVPEQVKGKKAPIVTRAKCERDRVPAERRQSLSREDQSRERNRDPAVTTAGWEGTSGPRYRFHSWSTHYCLHISCYLYLNRVSEDVQYVIWFICLCLVILTPSVPHFQVLPSRRFIFGIIKKIQVSVFQNIRQVFWNTWIPFKPH